MADRDGAFPTGRPTGPPRALPGCPSCTAPDIDRAAGARARGSANSSGGRQRRRHHPPRLDQPCPSGLLVKRTRLASMDGRPADQVCRTTRDRSPCGWVRSPTRSVALTLGPEAQRSARASPTGTARARPQRLEPAQLGQAATTPDEARRWCNRHRDPSCRSSSGSRRGGLRTGRPELPHNHGHWCLNPCSLSLGSRLTIRVTVAECQGYVSSLRPGSQRRGCGALDMARRPDGVSSGKRLTSAWHSTATGRSALRQQLGRGPTRRAISGAVGPRQYAGFRALRPALRRLLSGRLPCGPQVPLSRH